MNLKIRKLTVSDNRLLVKLIKKMISDSKDTWIENIVTTSDSSVSAADDETIGRQYVKIFSIILNSLIEKFESDITEWFASLLSISVEEYKNLDFDTDINVVSQIKDAKEFNDFFRNACVVFNVKNLSEKITKILKGKFGSLIDSPLNN
jgi:hypothetical protein